MRDLIRGIDPLSFALGVVMFMAVDETFEVLFRAAYESSDDVPVGSHLAKWVIAFAATVSVQEWVEGRSND